MNMRTRPELLEPEDLLAMPDGDRYELIDGVPKEKPMGAESDEIALDVGAALKQFVKAKKLGHVYGSQTGFQCFPKDPKRVRMPDASFVATGKLPGRRAPRGTSRSPRTSPSRWFRRTKRTRKSL